MSYATDDFSESLDRVDVKREDIARVVRAWGHGDGMGSDAGHYRWSADGGTDWSGGFLCELRDGSYVYITGWCDYTGWGCQDGAEVYRFAALPSHDELSAAVKERDKWAAEAPPESEWDTEPADLNRWLVSAEGTTSRDRH